MATNDIQTLEVTGTATTIDTWVQAPTPSKAGPYKPSVVTWKHGMGTDEVQGIVEMSLALLTKKRDFYEGRTSASLAVVRAHQVLHTEAAIPPEVLKNFGGSVPDLKGVHYHSVTQIVKSGPDCTRMVEAVEERTGKPYITHVAPFLTTQYQANNQTYGPTRAIRDALRKPAFVSARAALQVSQATAGTAGGAAAVATPPTNDHNKRACGATADGTPRALFQDLTGHQGSPKVTDAATAAVDAYVEACRAAGTMIEPKVLEQLYKTKE